MRNGTVEGEFQAAFGDAADAVEMTPRMQALEERIQEHLHLEARSHEAETLALGNQAVSTDGSVLFVQQRPYGQLRNDGDLSYTERQRYAQRINTVSTKMAEPSYEDLELLIAKMVHEVDLQMMNFTAFYKLLSKELGSIDLTSKKGFIKKTLSDVISSMK